MAAGPVVVGALAVLAVGYCLYVWVRKMERPPSWTGFLSATMCASVLVLLPSIVAIYIPLVDFLNRTTVSLAK
jgi:EamA domain-containing membrane protein RarD